MFALLAFPGASAQAPLPDKKLDEIEKQIQALKQAVEELRRLPQPGAAAPPSADVPSASTNRVDAPAQSGRTNTNDPIARIRDEGLNRSQIAQTLSYLTDVIGPRLTGSPNLKRANEWTRDRLASWGLSHAHLEAWGPFGRGWSLKRFSAQIIEPYTIPLIGFPKAWSPGFDQPLVAEVVFLDAKTEGDLERYKGKLKGTIVLTSPARGVKARFEPLATRMTETNLLRLANANIPRAPATRSDAVGSTPGAGRSGSGLGRGGGPVAGQFNFQARVLSFLMKEEAALVVTPSSQGDGGNLFVSAASVPGSTDRSTNGPASAPRPSGWMTNAPAIPAQITLAVEDYNRLVRMIQQGEKLRMALDLQVQFHNDDPMAYNTIAEIPGSDRKDEIVMIGAHMDSWHSGTGATDNGAGVAATMEAVRILQALNLQPRRTVRIGLWTGEEQGLLGSSAYVSQHFGYYTNITNAVVASASSDQSNDSSASQPASTRSISTRQLVREEDYQKFSVYFNLDNGTGKIRGVYMQGNEAVRPLFRRWLEPFADVGAETLTLSNTVGTDHQSFDRIGLPGFQFLQDPIEYNSRTHHSNADVFDRIQADDLKQAAILMAAFLYNAALIDEKLPRKPTD